MPAAAMSVRCEIFIGRRFVVTIAAAIQLPEINETRTLLVRALLPIHES